MLRFRTALCQTRLSRRERLREFIAECAVCPGSEAHARLREGVQLLPDFAHGQDQAVHNLQMETLLAVGAEMCVVLGLMGEDPAFMVSRGEAGACLATVILHDMDISAEGATPALALLGAWASALLAGEEPGHAPGDVSMCVH